MAHIKKSAWVIKPWNFNSTHFHWPSLFNSSLEAASTLSLPFVFGVNLVLLAKSSLTKFWVLLESTKYQGCHVLVLSLKLHDVWCKSSTYCVKRNPRHHLFTSHLNFHIHLLIVFLGTSFNQEQPFALVAWVILSLQLKHSPFSLISCNLMKIIRLMGRVGHADGPSFSWVALVVTMVCKFYRWDMFVASCNLANPMTWVNVVGLPARTSTSMVFFSPLVKQLTCCPCGEMDNFSQQFLELCSIVLDCATMLQFG